MMFQRVFSRPREHETVESKVLIVSIPVFRLSIARFGYHFQSATSAEPIPYIPLFLDADVSNIILVLPAQNPDALIKQ